MERGDGGAERDDRIGVMLEEYRVLYALARMRLDALERRVPMVGAVLAGFLGGLVTLPNEAQFIYLLGLPMALYWYVRTTAGHAQSFEDILRRIEEIELSVNAASGRDLLRFQSSHPSRGIAVGGRTGTSVVHGVTVIAASMLCACVYLATELLGLSNSRLIAYGAFLGIVAVGIIAAVVRFHRYEYRRRDESATDS